MNNSDKRERYVNERDLSCFHVYDAEVFYESGKEASKGKGKAILVDSWTVSEGSIRLRLADFMTVDTRRW